ncbi:MAG: multiheme c-type cytochrome [Gemmatimonadota bacterium]|nr:multiheme c-type cytochrome [Gemmatimonadota bacterium]
MERAHERGSAEGEWTRTLAIGVAALLVFETITGLSLLLLPFSVANQVAVLVHTGAGLVLLVPFAWYQARHWRRYRRMPMTHVKLTGYVALLSTVAALVTGVVLTWQAAFATRIAYGWDLVHILATFALIASAVPHIVALVWRTARPAVSGRLRALRSAQGSYGRRTALATLGLAALVGLAAFAYRPVELRDELPEDYSYLYGPDRPFAPSLATTATGGPYDERVLSGSESCGTAGCHEEIAREWSVSAHRWSAMDAAFVEVQNVMAEQNGPESTRYCGGCHDPISLFAGTKNVFVEDLTGNAGYDEGVSCLACHAIRETDVSGNANYVMDRPDRYMWELSDGAVGKWVSDFLIRAYPRHHNETLSHTLFKSPEFCAACHKQFIDEEINQVGWVQLQNQYDNWRKSRWNHPGDATRTVECRECHMPLTESADPARGDEADYNRSADDGKHRSHRFLAANQFMPLALGLEGAEEQAELTERWLRGEIEIPEIADKWKEGPAVPIEILAPERVVPGESVGLEVAITNNKVGHDFPTGPLDIIQAWIELVVTDQEGRTVFETGRRDDRHFIEPGSFIFKAEPVDQYGNLIDRHNLWEMVGVRYRRSMFPGFSDVAEFRFVCPGTEMFDSGTPSVAGDVAPVRAPTEGAVEEAFELAPPEGATELRVRARLLYRKADQFLLNFLFGEGSGLTSPVTVMSEDEATIAVSPRGSPASP